MFGVPIAQIDTGSFLREFTPGLDVPEGIDSYTLRKHQLLSTAEDVACGEVVCTFSQAV